MKKTIQFFGFALMLCFAFAFTPANTEVSTAVECVDEMPPMCNGIVKVGIPMSYTGTVGVQIKNSAGVPVYSAPLPPGGGIFTITPTLTFGDTYEVCLGATTPVTVAVKYSFCGEYSAETSFPIPTAGIAFCMPDLVELF